MGLQCCMKPLTLGHSASLTLSLTIYVTENHVTLIELDNLQEQLYLVFTCLLYSQSFVSLCLPPDESFYSLTKRSLEPLLHTTILVVFIPVFSSLAAPQLSPVVFIGHILLGCAKDPRGCKVDSVCHLSVMCCHIPPLMMMGCLPLWPPVRPETQFYISLLTELTYNPFFMEFAY